MNCLYETISLTFFCRGGPPARPKRAYWRIKLMQIISETLNNKELKQMAANGFGNLVKAVVDVDKGLVAVDAELHSDLEYAPSSRQYKPQR